MCFSTPSAPDPGAATASNLRAQIKYAPQVYAQNAEFSPLYTQLGLSNLAGYLNGANGKGGFLDLYQNSIMPALTAAGIKANTQTRTANLTDAAALTPKYIASERAANPGAAGLLDQLTSRTGQELSYGTELTPAEKVQLHQSVRGGAAARGMGVGPSDVFNESMADTGLGQNLLQQRMGNAQSLVPTLQGFYGDPTAIISGMGSSNAGMSASSLTGMAGGSLAPSMLSAFDPQNAMAMQSQSQQYQTNVAGSNNKNAIIGMGVNAGMGVGSGLLAGAASAGY